MTEKQIQDLNLAREMDDSIMIIDIYRQATINNNPIKIALED